MSEHKSDQNQANQDQNQLIQGATDLLANFVGELLVRNSSFHGSGIAKSAIRELLPIVFSYVQDHTRVPVNYRIELQALLDKQAREKGLK